MKINRAVNNSVLKFTVTSKTLYSISLSPVKIAAGRFAVKGPPEGNQGFQMSKMVDTLLNLEVFLFIGLLIWLYFKKVD